MSKKYNMVSFGCQMNVSDSEFINGLMEMEQDGWVQSGNLDECDLVLMNTCVVRNTAEQRAKSRLMTLKPYKKRNPEMIVGVCGCLAQKDGQQLLDDFPFVDLVVGTRELSKIQNIVAEVERTQQRFVCVDDIDQPASLNAVPIHKDDMKGFITITYGCNNDCTFCIVPKTRGREWSRPAMDLVEEAQRMVDLGIKEITLLGQNVNSYNDGKNNFADLLARVDGVKGLERLRFTTSNPQDCTFDVLDAIRDLDSVCEHLHLPVQAGNDRVLEIMNRQYTRERYKEIIEGLRSRVPGVTVSTDIIVGFPGETEVEFEDTLRLAEEVRWDSAYTFVFSPRSGTVADTMDDPVPLTVKKSWLGRLMRTIDGIAAEKNAGLVGETFEILVEGTSRRSDKNSMGRTRGNKTVILDNAVPQRGDIIRVEITEAAKHTLFGKAVSPDVVLV